MEPLVIVPFPGLGGLWIYLDGSIYLIFYPLLFKRAFQAKSSNFSPFDSGWNSNTTASPVPVFAIAFEEMSSHPATECPLLPGKEGPVRTTALIIVRQLRLNSNFGIYFTMGVLGERYAQDRRSGVDVSCGCGTFPCGYPPGCFGPCATVPDRVVRLDYFNLSSRLFYSFRKVRSFIIVYTKFPV